MKTRHLLLVSVLLFSLAACGLFSVSSPAGEPLTAQALVGTDTIALRPTQAGAEQAATATATPSLIVYLPVVTTPDRWQPPVGATWQWQLDQAVDTSFDVAVYDVDLFDTDPSVVAALHAQGRKVICYLSAGSWEDWRPDADRFPAAVIGKDYGGWPGEKWLDIRQIDLLAPIMRARLDLCRDKGFDAVEPDNIDGYTNDTGFLLTYDDQLAYNTWLAEEAHARGLSIGLKNDGEQVADLLPYFDWALTEDCFFEAWCEDMSPFIEAGKPVFAAEYTDTGIITADFCSQAAALGFSAILKHRDLDAWMEACVSGGTAVSCPIFPANNIWNTPIEALSVHPNSAAYVNTIGASDNLHPDFGAGLWQGAPIGIPYVEVPGSQPKVGVSFTYDDESDPGPYPIPANAPIEGGPNSDGDRHVIVIDRDNCLLYELFYAWPQPDGSWTADSGAIFDLNSNALRPDGWTSADAAGLPILAGLVRYDEVAAGEIRHALRFTAPQTRRDYVWPARHYASSLTGAQYPPMGQRFRLKASYDISGFSPDAQVILQALKTYGMILADNGSPWFLSGAPDDRWDNDVLNELKQVQGLDFEAVDVSSLMVDPDSAQVRNSTTPTPTPTPTATRPASECVSDVNSNGIGDVVDILATAAEPGCVVYLPLVVARWRQPWEIATPAPTGTPTVTPTATSSASPTATPTPTPTSTSTPTATATTPSAGSPTVTPTPTATGTAITADLFVDDGNTTGTEDGAAQYPYNTVQEAINAASDGDAIAVAAGTYAENIRVQDKAVHLYGGYVGGAAADYAGGAGGDFSARNPTANTTHIQGDGTDSTVTLREAGASTVDGFRITGGSRSVEGLPWYNLGGGVYVGGGSPTIAHNIIENNDTRNAASPENENTGGGVYTTDAEVSILDNLIRNNISGRGAGIAIEGGSVIIRGNTVQGNAGVSDHGGGLYITSPSADISHNVIRGNEVGRALGYGWGGGITLFGVGSSATLAYNVITDNYAPSMGSGLFIDDGATATLDHELIYGNQCTESGGVGIYVDGAGEGDPGDPGSTVNVIHSTVASHNCSTWPGGNGLLIERNSQATVTNSIFWDHGGDDFWVDATSTFSVTYTTSQEAIAGAGNLTAGPLFAAAGSGDYHLQSTAGRWDPSANGGSGGWVVDASHSPAIDAGDPASDHAGEPIPNGGRANMGVYGNTAQASKSNATINRE